MRKFLVILLLPIFLKSVQVVSTENPVIIPKQEVYSLTHTPYHFYYQDIIESPKFYGETPVYSTEDLIKESGKVKYIIPVVKKELVPVDFYHNNLPTPKYTKWQSFCKNFREKFYTVFRNSSKKAPPPKSYVVTENIEGDMYLIVLYYGETKYYMVFKSNKY